MKLLIALSAFAVVSVAAGGYVAVTSDTETGKELRSLIGLEECEGSTCSDAEAKPIKLRSSFPVSVSDVTAT